MNDNLSEEFESQKDISGLNLTIEKHSEKFYQHDMHERQIHELIRKQFNHKTSNKQFPTVRKMIQVINSQHLSPRSKSPKCLQQQTTTNSQLICPNTSKRTNSNRNKKLKEMSRLITLKKDVIQTEKADKKDDLKNIKQDIQSLIDDIYSARSANAFFSQPHYTQSGTNDKKKSQASRLLTKIKDHNTFQSHSEYISIPGSYKTISSPRNSSQQNYQNKELSKAQKDMNKLEAQKGYINSIRQLGVNRRIELQKSNLYHTIDANKTQKWFETARYSRKKIYQLIQQKQASPKQKLDQPLTKKNQYVQKLLEKFSQLYVNLADQVKQIAKARDKKNSFILINRKEKDQSRYRVKEKQYFRIQISKNSKQFTKKEQSFESIKYLLPEIKPGVRL